MKKILLISLILVLFSLVVSAQTTITTCAQLQAMKGNLAGNYALETDIDCSATSGWNAGAGFEPIGNEINPFTGTFDGQGHTITGLFINRPVIGYVGLFGFVSLTGSEIKNVGLVNVDITGRSNVGGLVGYNYNKGIITNSYSTGSVTGYSSVGGLVGRNTNNGIIINSYSTANANGDGYTAGGLVGYNDYATITNSYSTGSVTGGGNLGGLVGQNTNSGKITNSYSTGSVAGGSNNVGGLVGYNTGYGIIINSYSTGSVTSGGQSVGGLVGRNYNGVCTNSFWDTQTSGQSTSSCETGKTTAEMKQQTTFTNWDFVDVWNMWANDYPHLIWEAEVIVIEAPTLDCPSLTSSSCGAYTDSDGGAYLYTKGTISDGTDSITDKCGTNKVYEGHCCYGGKCAAYFPCPSGCSDGACIGPPAKACSDSDGKGYYTKRNMYTSDSDGLGYKCADDCIDTNTLKEYYCDGNVGKYEEYTCPTNYICKSGACKEEVIETPTLDCSTILTCENYGNVELNCFNDPCDKTGCAWDGSTCTSSTITEACGNDLIGSLEACDGGNLNGKQCSDFEGYTTGTLACLPNCEDYDFTGCISGCDAIDPQECSDLTPYPDLCKNNECPIGTFGCYWDNETDEGIVTDIEVCKTCDEISMCEKYPTQNSCDNDFCGLGTSCLWDQGSCKQEFIDEFGNSVVCENAHWSRECKDGYRYLEGECDAITTPKIPCRVTKQFPFFSSNGVIIILVLLIGYYVFINLNKKK